jgi:hypothetical protein
LKAGKNNPHLFRFTDDQRNKLLKTLGKSGPAAELFITDVEELLHESRSSINGDAHKPPSKKARMQRFHEINGAALMLRAALKENQPGNGRHRLTMWIAEYLKRDVPPPDYNQLSGDATFNAYMAYHVPYEEEAEDIADRLFADLGTLVAGLEFEARAIASKKQGRPQAFAAWGFFVDVGKAYRARFGRLPSPETRGKFHAFVVEALGCAGIYQKSWYKPLKSAIDTLKRLPES